MGHRNVKIWLDFNEKGPRPCDWCGDDLDPSEKYIHTGTCATCGRRCLREERNFYIDLSWGNPTDITLPIGYEILIPDRKDTTK